jgi:hypothetical protein
MTAGVIRNWKAARAGETVVLDVSRCSTGMNGTIQDVRQAVHARTFRCR